MKARTTKIRQVRGAGPKQRPLVLWLAVVVLAAGGGVLMRMVPPKGLPLAADTREPRGVPAGYGGGEPIVPVEPARGLDRRKVALGGRLFRDPRLSRDGSVACMTCHDLARGGTDHRMHPVGPSAVSGEVNTLTVFNSSRNFRFLWDGRAATLAQLIDITVTSPRMLGSSWSAVVARIKGVPDYIAAFKAVYPSGISRGSITDALAEFDRSLVTPDSRFDDFLRGNERAITPAERHGYELFKSYGCASCHQGMNVGGNMFQVFGVMADYFTDRGRITGADLGRFNVTGNEQDRYVFRVPSLRNVALTAPYFHDGTAPTLADAVDDMAKYQLGRPMPEADQDDIVRFLKTLTGKYRGAAP